MNSETQQGRFACTTEKYNSLYSRYLRNPEKLLEMTHYQTHHSLLDLCGGTGAISLAALELGAEAKNITLLDLNPRCDNKDIRQIRANALLGLQQLTSENKQFDIVVCRQAFAYLDVEGKKGEELAYLLAKAMRPGARFIFNSFIRPRWLFKTYRYEGARYIEMAGFMRRTVFRWQIHLGKGHDLTFSKWHREERIFEIFSPFFKVETHWSQNAVYWILTRKTMGTDNS